MYIISYLMKSKGIAYHYRFLVFYIIFINYNNNDVMMFNLILNNEINFFLILFL